MTARARARAGAAALVLWAALGEAPARAAGPVTGADAVAAARREGAYAFCANPQRPVRGRAAGLCALAEEVPDCEGFARACAVEPPKPPASSGLLDALAKLAGPVGQVLVWLLVIAAVSAVAIPVLRTLLRARRARARRAPERARVAVAEPVRIAPPEPEHLGDAEAALRAAGELADRGELERALALYLTASLVALDRRGALRLARHRTHGEYVRSCAEEASRPALREIVREVDRAQFGRLAPTRDAVARVAARAAAIVRTAGAAATVLLALLVLGCGALPVANGAADPAGDALPMDVLRRTGFDVDRLGAALATMPLPEPDDAPRVVLVDLERVTLEDEAAAHLVTWVEAGGVLVLLGDPSEWPAELGASGRAADTRDLTVAAAPPVDGARVASARALTWDGEAVARLGGAAYAMIKEVGRGAVLGVAGGDLLTNVGVARPQNADALVALVRMAEGEALERGPATAAQAQIRVALPEDGIPPPSNPFAALVRAGLGTGAWHALAACLVLFAAFGARHARARPLGAPARRAFAEHVEATGAFYARAGAHALALAAYGRFVEMRLRERVPPGGDPVAFLAAGSGVDRTRIGELHARAAGARPDDERRGDELRVIEELRAILAKSVDAGR